LYELKVKGISPASINGWSTYALAGSRIGKPGTYALAGCPPYHGQPPYVTKVPTMGKGAGVGNSGM
jgi:hypothetical protein